MKIVKRFTLSYGFYLVFAAVFLAYSFASDHFLTVTNAIGVLLDSNALFIVCVGLTFVVLTGSLDLSIGSVAFLTAALSALLMQRGVPVPLALLAGVTAGATAGAVNGFLVARFRLNPMLTTLGMMIGLRGLALAITNGSQIYVPDELKAVGRWSVGPIPLIVLFGIALLMAAQLALSRTDFGRTVIAVGCDAKAARKIGLPVDRITFTVFFISGITAGIAGIVSMINIGAVQPYLGKGMEFIAVAAVVLGGTSLFGGSGSFLPGAFMGVLMLMVIENGLNLMGASPYVYPFIRGLIIFAAMYADALKIKVQRTLTPI